MQWAKKAIKACQGKGRGALPLREWLCHPFSSTGLSSPCEFVLSQPQHRINVSPLWLWRTRVVLKSVLVGLNF